jgi:hypothetical protein
LLFASFSIREITAEVGAAVIQAAVAEGLAEGHGDVGPRELKNMSKVWGFSTYHFTGNYTIFDKLMINTNQKNFKNERQYKITLIIFNLTWRAPYRI